MPEKKKKKTAKKTAKRGKPKRQAPSPRSGVALPAGSHDANTGGKEGRSGRIPNELKTSCQDVAFLYVFPKLEKYLKRSNVGVANLGWRWAAATILDRGFGKVPQPVTGDDEGDPIGVRVEREEAALRRIWGQRSRIASRTPQG